MALNEINSKYYGFKPKTNKTPEAIADLDRVHPYEFRKGMDYELVDMGCMRLKESTPEEREKATEKVLKNLETHPAYYSGLLQFEAGMNYANKIDGKVFKTWLKDHFENPKMKEVTNMWKKDKMKDATHKNDKMEELKESIKKEIKSILNEKGGAKSAAMADMEDDGEMDTSKKNKTKGPKSKQKDKPIRKDRFDREEEAIKDILFRVDAKGKKPKEEGDYTKDNPAPGSMLFIKDQLLEKYKTEIKDVIEDPKKRENAYNDLQKEANDEFEEVFNNFNKEFDLDNNLNIYTKGQPLFQTIKNLQERLKLGLNKARAGVEVESRGMRRKVAETQMTREEALRLLEIVKENGISLREGTENIKVYYEIAKASYLEGVANALKL